MAPSMAAKNSKLIRRYCESQGFNFQEAYRRFLQMSQEEKQALKIAIKKWLMQHHNEPTRPDTRTFVPSVRIQKKFPRLKIKNEPAAAVPGETPANNETEEVVVL